MSVEDFELHKLTEDLTSAGLRVGVGVRRELGVSGKLVRDRARETSSGLRHAPAYPRSITMDIHQDGVVMYAEVGPEKDLPQGALGNLIEYGSPHSPPHNDLGGALDERAPSFEGHLAEAATILIWP